MKQFRTIFAFEFLNYFRKGSFLIVTFVLMALIVIALCIPVLRAQGGAPEAERIAFSDGTSGQQEADAFNTALESLGYELVPVDEDEAGLRALVENGTCDQAVYVTGPLTYSRFVRNLTVMDSFPDTFERVMLEQYQQQKFSSLGVPQAELVRIEAAEVTPDVQIVASGQDQSQTIYYTIVLIYLLYFAIVMYGQFVASGVAMEKSSRTMELLITSANPRSLMFGKVFGTGCAGLFQLGVLICTGLVTYNINSAYYADSEIVQSIFSMPPSILAYAILFFALGFFIYAFLYAAMGSLVSRIEDAPATVMPLTVVLLAMFFLMLFSLGGGGNVNNPVIVIGSFVPLTSPMAMFIRITMGQVAPWEIVLSVGILVVTVILIGLLATAIYRLGVLMYGKPPRLREVFAMLRRSGKQSGS